MRIYHRHARRNLHSQLRLIAWLITHGVLMYELPEVRHDIPLDPTHAERDRRVDMVVSAMRRHHGGDGHGAGAVEPAPAAPAYTAAVIIAVAGEDELTCLACGETFPARWRYCPRCNDRPGSCVMKQTPTVRTVEYLQPEEYRLVA